MRRLTAFGLFALLMAGAPLAFGLVDRSWQIAGLVIFAAGMFLRAPALDGRQWLLVVAGTLLLAAKEFLPFSWFGETHWRSILANDFLVSFLPFQNPEPGRAIEAILAAVVGMIWFVWVRTLARGNRAAVVWIIFWAAALLAMVCLLTRNADPNAGIYGWRPTAGWRGYGPFPNRNHTACFLAMGGLVGCGCIIGSLRRRRYPSALGGLAMLVVVLCALFLSQSRGGGLALLFGLGIYLVFLFARYRSPKIFVLAIAGALLLGTVFLLSGQGILERLASFTTSGASNQLRRELWKNTALMWLDAPLFGHGLETFPRLFPLYQQMELENMSVLHPESSWLLWLVELGALPVVLLAGTILVLLLLAFRADPLVGRGFHVRALCLCAFLAFLFHSLLDVPAHRWGTVVCALAALAVAVPGNVFGKTNRFPAWLILGIAAIFGIPFICREPAWSPSALTQALKGNGFGSQRREFQELANFSRYFPLDPKLNHLLGRSLLHIMPEQAWRYFRVAERLNPTSWEWPALHARLSQPYSPEMGLHFWANAIERAGHRAEEVFFYAHEATKTDPLAGLYWDRFVEAHPSLLLGYFQLSPELDRGEPFRRWFQLRADHPEEYEVAAFYRELPQWGQASDLQLWMQKHPELEQRDFQKWARVFYIWKQFHEAWKLIAKNASYPAFPAGKISSSVFALEANCKADPKDAFSAQALAQLLFDEGKKDRGEKVILQVASRVDAPDWFKQRAAFIYAEKGELSKAVALFLGIRQGD